MSKFNRILVYIVLTLLLSCIVMIFLVVVIERNNNQNKYISNNTKDSSMLITASKISGNSTTEKTDSSNINIVKVLELKCSRYNDSTKGKSIGLDGRIQNTSEKPIKELTLHISLLDKNKKSIFEKDLKVVTTNEFDNIFDSESNIPLKPNNIKTLDLRITNDIPEWSGEFEYKFIPVLDNYKEYTITDYKINEPMGMFIKNMTVKRKDKNIIIDGEFINDSDIDLYWLNLVVNLVDSSGKEIGNVLFKIIEKNSGEVLKKGESIKVNQEIDGTTYIEKWEGDYIPTFWREPK